MFHNDVQSIISKWTKQRDISTEKKCKRENQSEIKRDHVLDLQIHAYTKFNNYP